MYSGSDSENSAFHLRFDRRRRRHRPHFLDDCKGSGSRPHGDGENFLKISYENA